MNPEAETGADWRQRPALWGLVLLGTAVGISSFIYYYIQNLTLAHYDAKAHLVVARSIVDAANPGYAQLGTHWLPLIHLIYLPLVVFESQYRTGLLPSIISVTAFVTSVWLVYRISFYFTGSVRAGFFAGALLLANPNLWYLQSCPLTEPLFMALFLLSTDGFVRWRDGQGGALPWLPALWTALAALCRFEGWYFLGGVLLLLAYDAVSGHLPRERALLAGLLYSGIFAIPVLAHFGYLYTILHDNFLMRVAAGHAAPGETYQRPFLSVVYHLGELAQISSLLPLIAGFAGLIFCLTQRDRLRRRLPLFLLWAPSLINISALTWGMIYRVRYSVLLLPAIAIFAGLLLCSEKTVRRVFILSMLLVVTLPWVTWLFPQEWRFNFVFAGPGRDILPVAAVVVFLFAIACASHRWALLAICIMGMHIPVLRGEYHPMLREALEHEYIEGEREQALACLRNLYDGSGVLVDIMTNAPLLYDSALPLREFIHNGGDKAQWYRAIAKPDLEVGWILAQQGDDIWNRLLVDPDWAGGYSLALQTDNFLLYRLVSKHR